MCVEFCFKIAAENNKKEKNKSLKKVQPIKK